MEPLIETLKEDEDRDVRRNAAKALGWIGGKRAVEHLTQALNDESHYVRGSAAESLEFIGDMRAVEHLIEALNDKNVFVRMSAAKALDGLGRKPKDEIEKALYLVAKREWGEVINLPSSV